MISQTSSLLSCLYIFGMHVISHTYSNDDNDDHDAQNDDNDDNIHAAADDDVDR